MMLDKRRHAYRPDLADVRLRGYIDADRFVEGVEMQIGAPLAPVRREPKLDAMQLTQALRGEVLRVFELRGDWAFVQLARDGYVGYVDSGDLLGVVTPPTHRVSVPRSFIYPAASLKTQPAIAITLNAEVTVVGASGNYAELASGGFVYAAHLRPLGEPDTDYVAVAERFLHTPYYWGGKSIGGIDCSGLVQLAFEACGRACPRDSDMQEKELGQPLPLENLESLRRGDLVFWKGHVGIMQDADTLLHANGHHMLVVSEPLRPAIARIAASESPVTSLRRP